MFDYAKIQVKSSSLEKRNTPGIEILGLLGLTFLAVVGMFSISSFLHFEYLDSVNVNSRLIRQKLKELKNCEKFHFSS